MQAANKIVVVCRFGTVRYGIGFMFQGSLNKVRIIRICDNLVSLYILFVQNSFSLPDLVQYNVQMTPT